MSTTQLSRMKDEITWEARAADAAASGYVSAAYEDGVLLRAQVDYSPERVRNDAGEEVVAGAMAWVATGDEFLISTKDRITLPDGSTPEIINVARHPDARAASFMTLVWFGGRG